jgi:HPt (histidine-containing phosphotransfer) domain-containing protein
MDDYLSKPFTPAELTTKVDQWITSISPQPAAASDDVTAQSSTAGSIDQSVLADLRDLNILPKAIELFLSDTPPRLAALRKAIMAGDSRAVARHAHGLRGSSGNLGALRMVQTCATIEALAGEDDLASARELIDGLIEEYDRARAVLETERVAG